MSYPESYLDWLKDLRYSDSRIILVEIHKDDVVYGLSDYPYASDDLIYDALIEGDIEIIESIDNPSGVGELTFIDDRRNHWAKTDFSGQKCQLFMGDLSWSRDQFQLLVDAVIADIEPVDDNVYRINFDNTDYRLDKEIETEYIDNQLVPFALGSPFNCAPILIDYGQQIYQFNNDKIDSVAVRDIGITPSSVTAQLSRGDSCIRAITCGANHRGYY